jgi:diaminopimelate epimerase
VATVRIAMGRPILDRAAIPLSGQGPGVREPVDHPSGRILAFTGVSMGNPHAVIFVADEDPLVLARTLGPGLEKHARFPRKVNVELVRPEPNGTFTVGVWERGAGLTAACGTGACAIGVAACLEGRAQPGRPLTLNLPGGPLGIEVAPDLAQVYLEGPATLVFAGTVDPAALPPAEACLRLQSALA